MTSNPWTENSQKLVDSLLSGDLNAVRSLYTGPADIDDPFDGHQVEGGFESMVKAWGPTRFAKSITPELTCSTIAENHVGTEINLRCEKDDGSIVNVGIVVVSEKGADGKFDKTRMYYRRAMLDGIQHWRERLFGEPMEGMPYDGHFKDYHESLIAGDAEKMISTFAEGSYFDGHGGVQDANGKPRAQSLTEGKGMGLYLGKPEIKAALDQMFSIMRSEGGAGADLKHHVHFTDGKVHVVEFTIVHPKHPLNRVTGGVACYQLDDEGRLEAARIYDEAW